MSMTSGAALGVVHGYLDTLGAGAGASRALLRQRSWALREAVLFAAARGAVDVTRGLPLTPAERARLEAAVSRVPFGDLLAEDFAEQWLAHADTVLRGATASVPATQRARLTSLRALAAFAGAELPAHREGKPGLRTVLTTPEVDAALRVLTQRLPGRGPDDHVRLAAVLSVMSVWPLRSLELSELRLDQVLERGSDVVLAVRTDGAEQPTLRGVAAARMREWLDVRDALVGALSGGPVRALWTSIRSNSRPGGPRGSLPLPPGMPLRPRGMQRAYARSVEAANLFHQGVPGFPLPRSLDLLRRSLESSMPSVKAVAQP